MLFCGGSGRWGPYIPWSEAFGGPRILVISGFGLLLAAALAQPTDEPSDHERGQQERDDHAHADEHIGENDSGAALRWSWRP